MNYDLKEFLRVANAFHNTAVVDNDFPEMKERYQLEFARLERAVKENGAENRMHGERLPALLREVGEELERARATHAPMNSHHEGYAVILEELDELWEICKMNTHKFGSEAAVRVEQRRFKREAMRKEAIQVAAMAIRFIEDVCDK